MNIPFGARRPNPWADLKGAASMEHTYHIIPPLPHAPYSLILLVQQWGLVIKLPPWLICRSELQFAGH